jgi:NAD(P)-dependent dehydrogenase (short-subunit alcohol dehydrogenase family)
MALCSATKYAVAGYSEALDHELRTMGIRVSVVEPAYINTPNALSTCAARFART